MHQILIGACAGIAMAQQKINLKLFTFIQLQWNRHGMPIATGMEWAQEGNMKNWVNPVQLSP